jgi:cytochrome c553
MRAMGTILGGRATVRALALAAGVAVASAPALTAEGDAALGEYLSSECVTCHQVSGQVSGGVPSIVAWPADQFVAVLSAYKTKIRDNAVMQTIAGRLSDEEIAALAAYFGKLPEPHAR